MTVLHSGSNNKYSGNWERVFKQAKSVITAEAEGGGKPAGKKSAEKKVERKSGKSKKKQPG